jgi:dolichol-phosphate mannosyltransferase
MLFAASAAGLTLAEVPITFVERRQGESKLSQSVLIESAITPWRLIGSRRTARQTVR